MRLSEHEDFGLLLAAAARELGLAEVFIEKDYWITTILSVAVATLPERVIFKGGTSLSKAYGILNRFSEDVDLFVDPGIEPPLGKRAVDRTLKKLRDDVAAIPGLTLSTSEESRTLGGFSREDTFVYQSQFPEDLRTAPTVRLEPGVQSGKQPTECRQISSLVSDYIRERPEVAERLTDVDDLEPFDMEALHFKRTFVEKLFTIHGKVERFKQDGTHPQRDVRHYADLYVLGQRDEVRAMLTSPEYEAIRTDYDEVSRRYYASTYRPPDGLRFNDSDALFPSDELRAELEPVYDRECRTLFPGGDYPPFEAVLGLFAELRGLI